MNLKTKLALSLSMAMATGAHAATEIVIATVNNGHMIEMQKLTPHFEKANPDIKLKWVTLEEGVLRQRVTTDIATKGGHAQCSQRLALGVRSAGPAERRGAARRDSARATGEGAALWRRRTRANPSCYGSAPINGSVHHHHPE